jgi:drug/metabolite transporter (DMT)-like permease
MHPSESPSAGLRLAQLAPAIVAATAFGCADVLTKLTLQANADALTMTLFRGFIGLPLLAAWLFVGAWPVALVLGEVITPLQGFGGAVMIAALAVFQAKR